MCVFLSFVSFVSFELPFHVSFSVCCVGLLLNSFIRSDGNIFICWAWFSFIPHESTLLASPTYTTHTPSYLSDLRLFTTYVLHHRCWWQCVVNHVSYFLLDHTFTVRGRWVDCNDVSLWGDRGSGCWNCNYISYWERGERNHREHTHKRRRTKSEDAEIAIATATAIPLFRKATRERGTLR